MKIKHDLNCYSSLSIYICESGSESESHSVVSGSLWPHALYSPWNSLGHNTGMGSLSLLQGIFPTQGLNPGLPHCRQILYHLSYHGGPYKQKTEAKTFTLVCFWLRLTQSCPTPCDSMDYSLPGSSVRGTSQARTLSWVAISSSRGSSQTMNWICISSIAGRFFTTSAA